MRIFVDFVRRNHEKTWFAFAVAAILSALTLALPIWLGGIRQTSDTESHLHFAQAFRAGITVGDLYPAWANDNLGFGSVGIRFYPPIAAFTSALFQLVTGDWYRAFSLSLFLWMLVGCFGMCLFVREWSSPGVGLMAGILYAVVPYHVAHIFRFFLYAEFASMAAVPFVLLYLTRVCRRANWRDVVPLAASFSVLILTHIPVTLMVAFSLLIYVPVVVDYRRWKKVALQLACAGGLAIGATTFYWIRVLTELPWVAHSDMSYTVAGYERGPLLFPNLLVDYDISFEVPFLRHLDIVTALTIVLLTPWLVTLIARRRTTGESSPRIAAAASLSAMFGIFMLSKPSRFLWAGVGIFQRLQYPWRWLAIVSALAVVSISVSLALLVERGRISRRAAFSAGLLLILGFAIVDIKQIHGTPNRLSAAEFNDLAAEVQSQRVADHWWPSWAKEKAFQNRGAVTSETGRSVEILNWESERRLFAVGDGEAERLGVATFYYPYWRATVDAREVEVGRDENGVITVPAGQGPTEVALRFEEPTAYKIAGWLSLTAWVFFLGYFAFRYVWFGCRNWDGIRNGKAADKNHLSAAL